MSLTTIELSYPHTGGLGDLGEVALLNIFAWSLANRLTEGKPHTARDIVGSDGSSLYPSFFTTRLRVPPTKLLSNYQLWNQVSVGVECWHQGAMLDSTAVLGQSGEIEQDPSTWKHDELPCLRGGSIFIVDNQPGVPRAMRPRKELLAELPELSASSKSRSELIGRFDSDTARGHFELDGGETFRTASPIRVPVINGRNVFRDRNLMFSQFTQIVREAERILLTEQLETPFPTAVADHREVLDSEIHYLSNCGSGATLRVDVAGRMDACDPQLHGKSPVRRSSAVLSLRAEVSVVGSNELLAIARSSQLIIAPSREKALLRDAKRLAARYS